MKPIGIWVVATISTALLAAEAPQPRAPYVIVGTGQTRCYDNRQFLYSAYLTTLEVGTVTAPWKARDERPSS
jgi:hypothetical protein